MIAVMIKKPGGRDEMYVSETEYPEMGASDLLVRVHATAVNRGDILQRKGFYPPPAGASSIMGLEIAGTVEKTGVNCTGFKIGDRIFSIVPGGGYAEFACLDYRLAMKIPEYLSFEEAAAIPEAFLTAYQALFSLGDFRRGENVLIHAGASGVGSAAIQLVSVMDGTSIITAGSDEKCSFCKELGANHTINYQKKDFETEINSFTSGKGADIIIDFIGAAYFERNLRCLSDDGRLIMLALMGGRKVDLFDLSLLLLKRVKVMGSTLRGRDIQYKSELIKNFWTNCKKHFDNGSLKPLIYRSMPLSSVKEAHEIIESNQNMGKIVLTIG